MPARRIRSSVTLDPDIVGFASLLAQVFGSRARGLAAFIRLTPEFAAWRQRVEWCPVCRSYAPTDPPVGSLRRYAAHDRGIEPCPAVGRSCRWTGEPGPEQIGRPYIRRLAEGVP